MYLLVSRLPNSLPFTTSLEALRGHWEMEANVKLDTMLLIYDLLRGRCEK